MRRRAWVVVLLLGAAALTGCGVLPESGAVHTVHGSQAAERENAPFVDPAGPVQDASPSAVVTGFLVAMQSNPLSTSVARTFLSERAHDAWKPNRGTLVYEGYTTSPSRAGVTVHLADVRRLDGRGGWLGGSTGRTESLGLHLVAEKGQWRIDNPPNSLMVRSSFFDRNFARYNLYFFDQTGRTLLPDPVFIPRGPESATKLVRGLLSGPGRALADVARSAFPRRTSLHLSVLVTERGVAEVPLSREVLELSRSELNRAAAQLVRTLRQDPDIRRVRITVDGVAVPLPTGLVDAPDTTGAQYDASGSGPSFLWGLRAGRVVDLGSEPNPVPGPFSRPGYALRTLAVSPSPHRIAAVSTTGRSVFVAPADDPRAGTRVVRVVDDGTDILRPQYDVFGDLWLVDRTSHGARVLVVRGRTVREIRVPGVTGADVSAFSVALDGSRIAVAYQGSPAPPLRVVDVLRTDEGLVSGAGHAESFSDGRDDGARIVDVGWRDPSSLAVLTRPTIDTSQVDYISADGSPVDSTLQTPNVFHGAAQELVVSPDLEVPVHLVTGDQRLYTLDVGGSWPRTTSRVLAATYVR